MLVWILCAVFAAVTVRVVVDGVRDARELRALRTQVARDAVKHAQLEEEYWAAVCVLEHSREECLR